MNWLYSSLRPCLKILRCDLGSQKIGNSPALFKLEVDYF